MTTATLATGKQLSTLELKRWAKDNRSLALAVLQAQAYAEVTRQRVNEYVQPIFDSFHFKYCGEVVEMLDKRKGEPVAGDPLPSMDQLYLCDDPRLPEFYAACDKAHVEHGYTVEQPGNCPALEAEHLQRQAQWALLESGAKLLGVDEIPYGVGGETQKKALQLFIGMCICEDDKESIMKDVMTPEGYERAKARSKP